MQMLPNEIRFRDPIAIAECLLYRDSEDIKSMMKMNNIHLEDITGVLDDLANGTNALGKHSMCCQANSLGEICRCTHCLDNPGEICPALMASSVLTNNIESTSWSENNSNANMNDFVNKLIQSQDDIPRELAGLSLNCGLLSNSVANSTASSRNNLCFPSSPVNVTTEVSQAQVILLSNAKTSLDDTSQFIFENCLSCSNSGCKQDLKLMEQQANRLDLKIDMLHKEQNSHSSLCGDTNNYLLDSSSSNKACNDETSSQTTEFNRKASLEEANLSSPDHVPFTSLNQSIERKEISSNSSVNISTSSSGSEFSFHSNESQGDSPQTPTIISKPINKIQVTRSSSVLPRCNSFDYSSIEPSSQWRQTGAVDDLVLNQIRRVQPATIAPSNSTNHILNNTLTSILSANSQTNWQFRPIKPQSESGVSRINNSVTNDLSASSRASPVTILKQYSTSNNGPPIVAPIPLHMIASAGSTNLSQNQTYVRGPSSQLTSCWTVLQPNNQTNHGIMNDRGQTGLAFTHHPAQSAFKTGRQAGLHYSSTTTPTREFQSNPPGCVKQTAVSSNHSSTATTPMIPVSGHNPIQSTKFTKHIVQTPQSGYLIIPTGYLTTSHQNGSSSVLVSAPNGSNSTTTCPKPQIAQPMKVNLVNPPTGSVQMQRVSAPNYSLTAKTVVSNSNTPTSSSNHSVGSKLGNSDESSSELILISSNAANVDNQQLQLVTQACVSPLANVSCSSASTAQQHSIINLAQPQFRINSKRSQAAMELHTKFELLVEQHRLLENDRKKTESELIRQNPGKKISHLPNNNLNKNSKDNTRVDKELNSILANHSRVVNLISKMEKLRNDPLPSNIHSAMDCWLEGIRKCQARRKEEMVNSTNRARCGGPRHQDDKDMLALSQSLSELCQHTRRARTSLWAALQMTDKEQSISLQQALNHLTQLASYSVRPQTKNNNKTATSISNSNTKNSNTGLHNISSSSNSGGIKTSSSQNQTNTTESLASHQSTPGTQQCTYNRAISVQSASSPSGSIIHQSQQNPRIQAIHQTLNSGPKIVFSTAPTTAVGGNGHALAYQSHPQNNYQTLPHGHGLYSMYYTCTPSGPQPSGQITYATTHIAHHPTHPHQLM